MSVADTVFPWIILALFIATTFAGYYFGSKHRDWIRKLSKGHSNPSKDGTIDYQGILSES